MKRTRQTATGNQRHKLSVIDTTAKKAICSICGLVGLHYKKSKGKTVQICCVNKRKEDKTKERRREYRLSVDLTCCVLCGFIPQDPCQLDVDHINKDHSDDSPENLQVICANCHRLKSKLEQIL